MRVLTAAIVLALAAGACAQQTAPTAPNDNPGACEPLEARPPNATVQEPAFEGQTRACGVMSGVAFDVEVVAGGLVHPWAVEPLPDGSLLVTERPGRMRLISAAGVVGEPIAGVPAVDARDQAGLLDVALSPTFAQDRMVFWSFSEPRTGGNGTAVARGVLAADGSALTNVSVIFRAMPTYDGGKHFGSRLAFGPDGMLYMTTGERSDAHMRHHAQSLEGHLGKVLRIRPDGSVPDDNPFAGRAGAVGEIWSYGHRNVQATVFDPGGQLWAIEHGPAGGDELNRVERGENYGWPIQSYGEEYSGDALPGASTAPAGMVQPVYYWDPVIAPSGAEWYTGDAFPAWRGSLFVGSMGQQRLVRLVIEDERVTGEEHLLADRGRRIRDVRQGAGGVLYVVTDEQNGEVWRIVPRG